MNGGFDDSAVRLQEREESARVTHPVKINEILMSPMVTEEHTLVEPMIGDIPIVPSGVIIKVDRFDESNVHNLIIKLIHRNLCRVIPGRGRRISKHDVPFALGFRTSHPDESVRTEERQTRNLKISSVHGPLSMVLWCKTGRRAAPTSCRTSPKDFIVFLFPRGFHVVDLFELDIHFIPTIGVTPRSPIVVVTRDSYIAVARSLGGREDGEQNGERPPVREKVTVEVMCPRVVTEGVIPMKFGGKAELIAWTG
jgi:hypothetical protein